MPYLIWDGSALTRNLIDKTPLYELIAICWEVGQISSVHNHRDQNCWMAVPMGRLLVQRLPHDFARPKKRQMQAGGGEHSGDESRASLRR